MASPVCSTADSLVSVIIPVFNQARFVACAINAVLSQTWKYLELIVVDDGSIDDSSKIIASFPDPRIHYVYQRNQGLSAARNTGIRLAQGEYLAFLDADDEWEPSFLDICVRTLANQETLDAVITLVRFIDETGAILPQSAGQMVSSSELRSRLLEGGFFPPNALLVRTKAVHAAGLFDESLTSVEDWDLWLRITANGGAMLTIPQSLARYRVYPGSMSTNAGRMHANRMAVLTKHFGPPEGDPTLWPAEKRTGFAFAHRAAALGYIAQHDPDEGWRHLHQAVMIEPSLLQRLDTFYELALGDQPRGYRGLAHLLDIERNGREMLGRLDALFAEVGEPVRAYRSAAYGNAYLALAMLSDQAGEWRDARAYFYQAVRRHPALLRDPAVLRRFLKLHAGRRTVGWLRRLRARSNAPAEVSAG